ncbi:MAG: nucleoside deaminase [Balneolales bacterium]
MNINFMREAINLANESVKSGRGGPFGAVVVRDEKILGRGSNLVTATNDPTAHAEMVAIRNACRDLEHFQLEGCEIYASCEPCPMCLGAIYWARPAVLYYACSHADAARYGFDDSFIYKELALPADQRTIPSRQVLREEALSCFTGWDLNDKKIPY